MLLAACFSTENLCEKWWEMAVGGTGSFSVEWWVQFLNGRQIVDGQLDLLGTVSIERTSHLQSRIRSPSYCWQNLELSCLEWASFCKQIESARFCSSNRQVYRQISQTFQDCRRWGTHRAVVWIFRGNDMPIGVLVCAWRTSDAGLKRNDIHGWNKSILGIPIPNLPGSCGLVVNQFMCTYLCFWSCLNVTLVIHRLHAITYVVEVHVKPRVAVTHEKHDLLCKNDTSRPLCAQKAKCRSGAFSGHTLGAQSKKCTKFGLTLPRPKWAFAISCSRIL